MLNAVSNFSAFAVNHEFVFGSVLFVTVKLAFNTSPSPAIAPASLI